MPAVFHLDRQSTLAVVALAVLTLALFSPVLAFQFINIDDSVYVVANQHVQQGLSWHNAWWALTSLEAANWHPVTWLSHMLDVTLFGSHAGGHHATSLLIHAFNAVLVFFCLRAMTGTKTGTMTAATWRSLIISAWFAVHPLALESVVWVAERKNVLSTFFLLLTVAAYIIYARKPSPSRYLAVTLFFILGLMSKAMLVTLPFALLLLDYWPLHRLGFPSPDPDSSPSHYGPSAARESPQSANYRVFLLRCAEKLPLLTLSALTSVLTVWAQTRDHEIKIVSWPSRVANALLSSTTYLRQMVWPANLAIFYPVREVNLASATVVFSFLFLCLITAFAIWQIRQRPYLAVGWFWYLGTLVPVSGLVHIGDLAHADRYTYVPLLGIFIALVWGLADLASHFPALRAPLIAAACLSVVALAATTWRDLPYWRDGISITEHSIAVTGPNCLMERSLGEAFYAQHRTDEALAHFERSLAIQPTDVAFFDVGTILLQQQKTAEAALYYQKALQYPGDPEILAQVHNNLAVIAMQQGAFADSESHFKASIALNPSSVRHRVAFGWLLAKEARYDEAISQYQEALKNSPDPLAYFSLGSALEAQHRLPQAAEAYRQTLAIAPGFEQAQARLKAIALNQP